MKLHELLIKNPAAKMTKLSADQSDMVKKAALDIVKERSQMLAMADEIAKTAAAEIENMDFSEPELQKVAQELLAYGAGLADGEAITKQAMVAQVYEQAYTTFISKIAEVMGEETAQQVDGALREAGGEEQAAADELEELREEITENVAEAIVENAGGIEEVTKDQELSADILQQASEIADQIIEEQLQSPETELSAEETPETPVAGE